MTKEYPASRLRVSSHAEELYSPVKVRGRFGRIFSPYVAFALFSVCSSRKKCPSAGCESAANVCTSFNVFGAENVAL
jgi:hypothetical protein